MMSMMIAITWKDFIDARKWKSDGQRGAVLLPFSIIMGFVIGYLCYFIIGAIQPIVEPGAVLSDVDKWHHVLYMGTYPLIPIIIFGVFSNHFNHIKDVLKKTVARTGLLAAMVVLGYLIFHYAVVPTGLFGSGEWFHQQDLIWNFTISIIALSHHWFCGKLGAVKKVPDPPAAA